MAGPTRPQETGRKAVSAAVCPGVIDGQALELGCLPSRGAAFTRGVPGPACERTGSASGPCRPHPVQSFRPTALLEVADGDPHTRRTAPAGNMCAPHLPGVTGWWSSRLGISAEAARRPRVRPQPPLLPPTTPALSSRRGLCCHLRLVRDPGQSHGLVTESQGPVY